MFSSYNFQTFQTFFLGANVILIFFFLFVKSENKGQWYLAGPHNYQETPFDQWRLQPSLF